MAGRAGHQADCCTIHFADRWQSLVYVEQEYLSFAFHSHAKCLAADGAMQRLVAKIYYSDAWQADDALTLRRNKIVTTCNSAKKKSIMDL